MSETPALQAQEVWKVFRRDGYDIEVLKGVSLSLARGETCLLYTSDAADE